MGSRWRFRLRKPTLKFTLPELPRQLKAGINVEKLVIIAALTTVFITALLLRLLRLKYGIYLLDEFDPYFQYWMAKYVADRGWTGFIDWFYWYNDPKFWHPYGRDVIHTAFPGVAFTGAFFYLLLKSVGINMDLMSVCAFLPAFMGSLTVVLMYNLGKEVEGKATGLYAAVFMAFNAAYLSRTLFGFFDDESVGIFALVCSLIFYARALKREGRILDALLAGLFLGYMASAWGAATYAINLFALHAILMVFIGKYSRKLLFTYSATMSVALLIASLIPKHGPGFLASGLSFLALVAYATLAIAEVSSNLEKRKERIALLSSILTALIVGFAGLWLLGYLTAPERYFSVLYPTIRSPLVASVAEHQAITWMHFFLDFQLALPLAFFGLYIVLRRRTEMDLLIALMVATTIYAAASMARLLVLLAPLICLLAGIGFSHLIKPLAQRIMSEEGGRRRRYVLGLNKKWSYALTVLTVIFFTPLASPAVLPITNSSQGLVARASTPQMIATSAFALTTPVPDWINTLAWMRDNLPPDAVVASWWDYGYHISVMTNRTSTCDNAALDHKHIAKIARAFLSNETEALEIYRELNVTHVVVFGYVVPYLAMRIGEGYVWYYASLGNLVGDDVVKSEWMALIAGLDPDDYLKDAYFVHPTTNTITSIRVPAGEKAEDAIIYQMIFNNYEGPLAERGPIIKDIEVDDQWRPVNLETFNVRPLEHFNLVYASEPNHFILVYEVVYD
ncbi:MAG: hypothetical protein DRN06_04425 [Thermoprotei archaeon]|nr:MAG: hypothetical protein DRN06_04425 [Thermoprotei archaeon]